MLCSEIIKKATRQLHAEAEAVVIRRLKGIRTRTDYLDLLTAFLQFFVSVEELTNRFITVDVLPDKQARRRSSLLIGELAGATQTIPEIHFLPAINDQAQAFGAMYVLEGSTLGGKIISRMMKENLTLQLSTSDLFFFNIYGDQTQEMWNTFTTQMNRLLISNPDIETAVAAAKDTFSKMKTWMQNTNA